MRSCDIVIPVWNELETTRTCIDSILNHTAYPYRLIIIDNGSDKHTRDYLSSLRYLKNQSVILIRNDQNLGFVKAINQGMRTSSAAYLCLMNNDTVATDGWLNEMAEVADAHSEIGLVNPSSNTSGQFPGQGVTVDRYALTLKHFKGDIQYLSTGRGFCMLIKREVVDKIGFLDEGYGIGYFEETDYSKKARKAGYEIARAKASYVWHEGSISFKNIKDNRALFEKNERVFYKRWGRPVKVGLFLGDTSSQEAIDKLARTIVNGGHQIWIFLKRGLAWPVKLDHYEIRKVDLNSFFFGFASIYQVLKRKKKKRVDIIVTDNVLLGSLFKLTRPMHGSNVIGIRDADKLAELMQQKSRDF